MQPEQLKISSSRRDRGFAFGETVYEGFHADLL